jgi:hypothetical protein
VRVSIERNGAARVSIGRVSLARESKVSVVTPGPGGSA